MLSLAVLAGAVVSRRLRLPAGASALLFVSTAMVALYFNIFVLIAQAFQKVPALETLAPTQSEPPFVIVQAVVLVVFGALTVVAARRARQRASTPLAARTPGR